MTATKYEHTKNTNFSIKISNIRVFTSDTHQMLIRQTKNTISSKFSYPTNALPNNCLTLQYRSLSEKIQFRFDSNDLSCVYSAWRTPFIQSIMNFV